MKRITIFIALILITAAIGCKPKPKTDQEIFQESMEGKSDDELISEMYGNPQNYEIVNSKSIDVVKPDSYPVYGNNKGGIIQIVFNKDKIFLQDVYLTSIVGSYRQGRYASPTGEIIVSFEKAHGFTGAVSAGLRRHPKADSEYIKVKIKQQGSPIEIEYQLKRLN